MAHLAQAHSAFEGEGSQSMHQFHKVIPLNVPPCAMLHDTQSQWPTMAAMMYLLQAGAQLAFPYQ